MNCDCSLCKKMVGIRERFDTLAELCHEICDAHHPQRKQLQDRAKVMLESLRGLEWEVSQKGACYDAWYQYYHNYIPLSMLAFLMK